MALIVTHSRTGRYGTAVTGYSIRFFLKNREDYMHRNQRKKVINNAKVLAPERNTTMENTESNMGNEVNETNIGKEKSKRGLALKIIVPVVLAAAVAGVWLAKNPGGIPTIGGAAEDTSSVCGAAPPAVILEEASREAQSIPAEQAADFALAMSDDFDEERIRGYGVPVILKFGAQWCGPCRSFEPIIQSVQQKVAGKAIIKDIDVDKYPELTQNYPISSIPAMVLFDAEGKPFESDDASFLLTYYGNQSTGEVVYSMIVGALSEENMLDLLTAMGMSEQ